MLAALRFRVDENGGQGVAGMVNSECDEECTALKMRSGRLQVLSINHVAALAEQVIYLHVTAGGRQRSGCAHASSGSGERSERHRETQREDRDREVDREERASERGREPWNAYHLIARSTYPPHLNPPNNPRTAQAAAEAMRNALPKEYASVS